MKEESCGEDSSEAARGNGEPPEFSAANFTRTDKRGARSCGLAYPAFSFEPLQVGANVASMLIAKLAIFLQSLTYDPLQFSRGFWIKAYWGGWRFDAECCRKSPPSFAR